MTMRAGLARRDPTGLPVWTYGLAALGVLLIVLPPLALLFRSPWGTFVEQVTSPSSLDALRLSLVTAMISTVCCLLIGVPMAVIFARHDGVVVRVVRSLVLLPLVLPPVVGGLALLYTFGRLGIVGEHLHDAGIDIAFTVTAVVLAQTFVALPFLVISVEGAVRVVGTRYEEVAATLGAGPTRTLWRVTLPLVAPSLLAGVVLAFARALGEFGATITFAGNAPGITQTAPLAIYVSAIDDPQAAIPLSLVLVVISLVVVVGVHSRRRRAGAGAL
ncbi:ABC transporter permease [Gordonia rubripertincta]|uniref:Molybdenum transport system permease n=2 Tax=Gordonia rubripertincta TaxID=36822 RepID=A0AAW6RCB0_GORRU|nr:ABC transporter permease [Gordonia rubripertincta]MDG6782253.1 ABC transporter permease [Gordonia rubripertincta]NKY65009.1 molybdate ABC transporter permease subunit [Gordonia rubripertincta]GAB84691.1 molybdate ABC transporter permease protein [Gordonia rubripertincta NBRC 101908]